MFHIKRNVFLVVLGSCFFGLSSAARAAFVYDVETSAGSNGSGPTGTVTFPGNSGDAVPNLNVAGVTFTFSLGAETWTQTNTVYGATSNFGTGKLGDATLTPFFNINGGSQLWDIDNSDAELYLASNGWLAINAHNGQTLDSGNSFFLQLPSVPEPASLGVLALGGMGLLMGRRRRG